MKDRVRLRRMTPQERYDWIEAHLRSKSKGYTVDVCDADFVASYIEATDASFRPTNYGAYKCRQLGKDLATMHSEYRLKRMRSGLEGMGGMGFPTWVWSYTLAVY